MELEVDQENQDHTNTKNSPINMWYIPAICGTFQQHVQHVWFEYLLPIPTLYPKVNEVLSKTCTQVCVEELSLQADHDFVVKVVQFQELLDVRHR